jgi:hypothetical protein
MSNWNFPQQLVVAKGKSQVEIFAHFSQIWGFDEIRSDSKLKEAAVFPRLVQKAAIML